MVSSHPLPELRLRCGGLSYEVPSKIKPSTGSPPSVVLPDFVLVSSRSNGAGTPKLVTTRLPTFSCAQARGLRPPQPTRTSCARPCAITLELPSRGTLA